MPQVPVAPFVLKDMLFSVELDNYEKHVSSVAFTPSTSTLTWQGGTPDATFTDTTAPTWVCALNLAQDWTTETSLARYLFDNAGQEKAVTFSPLGDGAGLPTFAATLILAPPPIGGDVNTYQTATVSCGVKGAPTYTIGA